MAAAAIHEISAMGVQDQALVAESLEEAVLTFWRFTHMKHTAFAIEPMLFNNVGGSVGFGASRVKFQFPTAADLAWATFARITIPGIAGLTSAPAVIPDGDAAEPYWTNAIGQHILQRVDLRMGEVVIDTLESHQLYFWEELAGMPGKRLSEMIGKYDTVALRQSQSRRARTLYVPVPFFFTVSTGLALPIIATQFHKTELECTFATLDSCIVKPGGTPAVSIVKRTDGSAGSTSDPVLVNSDLTVDFETFGVYLDHDERAKFASGSFEQIITMHQYQSMTVTGSSSSDKLVDMDIRFNHRVSEYIVGIRRKLNEDSKDWFNFGGKYDTISQSTRDPLKSMGLKFNHQDRFKAHPGIFYRQVVPYVFHTNMPREFIYVVPFAVAPEDPQPSGGANHSRIDHVHLELTLDKEIFEDGSTTASIFVGSRGSNTVRYKFGLTSLKYA